jgi:hypothetical protein
MEVVINTHRDPTSLSMHALTQAQHTSNYSQRLNLCVVLIHPILGHMLY